MSRAAERVGRTQAALSQQVKRLETAVPQTLMIRTGRGITLTHARRAAAVACAEDSAHSRRSDCRAVGRELVGQYPLRLPRRLRSHLPPAPAAEFRATASAGVRRGGLRTDAAAAGEAQRSHPGHRHRFAPGQSAARPVPATRAVRLGRRQGQRCLQPRSPATGVVRSRHAGSPGSDLAAGKARGASIASPMQAAASRDSWQSCARARRSPCSRTLPYRRIYRYCRRRAGCPSCRQWASP